MAPSLSQPPHRPRLHTSHACRRRSSPSLRCRRQTCWRLPLSTATVARRRATVGSRCHLNPTVTLRRHWMDARMDRGYLVWNKMDAYVSMVVQMGLAFFCCSYLGMSTSICRQDRCRSAPLASLQRLVVSIETRVDLCWWDGIFTVAERAHSNMDCWPTSGQILALQICQEVGGKLTQSLLQHNMASLQQQLNGERYLTAMQLYSWG